MRRAVVLLGKGKRPARRKTEDFELDFIPKQWFWNPPDPKITKEQESGWTPTSRRTGVVARKIGMSATWDEWGVRLPLTYLYVEDNFVVAHKRKETHGYDAVVMGFQKGKEKHVKKPQQGMFAKSGVPNMRHVQEFRVTPDAFPDVGSQITARHFVPSQMLKVVGTSKGKGFAGVMKRHNFGGGDATHGNTKAHRTQGSTGGTQDPGRVWPGKKMAGNMGNRSTTVWNLRVHKVIPIFNTIAVVGAVPGAKNSFVTLCDSNKPWKEATGAPPFPAYVRTDADRIETDPEQVDPEDIEELVGAAPMPWEDQLAKNDGWHVPTLDELKPQLDRGRLFQIEDGLVDPEPLQRHELGGKKKN